MRLNLLFALCGLAMLSACSGEGPQQTGADRDAHGCIGSAGYRWCAHTQQCERPWELAERQGIDNTAEAFDQFCAAPPGDG